MSQNASTSYISEEKKKELEQELTELTGPKRKAIIETLAYAKSLGDLSENAEYHQAREDQGKLESRIAQVEKILQSAEVVHGGGSDTVEVGSRVSVIKEGEKEPKHFHIVGAEEADMAEGKISNRSPFGAAMFGKKKGDSVKFKTPGGEANYKIINVA
jgi:transcription elongation factor GreA